MWKNYADFHGRANKRDYWMAYLIHFLVSIVVGVIAFMTIDALSYIYALAAIVPSLSIIVRRLRDAGKEWFWIFTVLIPCIGWIWLIILLVKPSVSSSSSSDWNHQ